MLTRDDKDHADALRRVKNLAAWDPSGTTSYRASAWTPARAS